MLRNVNKMWSFFCQFTVAVLLVFFLTFPLERVSATNISRPVPSDFRYFGEQAQRLFYTNSLDMPVGLPESTFDSSVGLQYSVQVRAVDSHNKSMVNAHISASSDEVIFASGLTNASGWWITTISAGYYNFTVNWRGVEVARQVTQILGPLGLTLECNVIYPSFIMIDDVKGPIQGAQVYIRCPNGTTTIQPFFTSETGSIDLTQEPAGIYCFAAWWKGKAIANQLCLIASNDGPYAIPCKIYELTLRVSGNNGAPIADAYVVVYSQYGEVFDLRVTDNSGAAVSKLPIGTYRIDVLYSGDNWLTHVGASASWPSVSVTSSSQEMLVLASYPPPFWTTVGFWLLVASLAIAVSAVIIFVMYRRKR